MKYLLIILLAPLLVVCNVVGGIAAFIVVGVVNGYLTTMELIDKSREEK